LGWTGLGHLRRAEVLAELGFSAENVAARARKLVK